MNNYEILGLQKGASISEVKSKFRQLSKKYHPDMPGGNAAKFISIREAYNALLKGDSGESTYGYGSGPAKNSRDPFSQYQQQTQESHRSHWNAQQAYRYQQQQQKQHQQDYFRRESGEFRFEGIKKDDSGYLIKFFVKNLYIINIYGKNGERIGLYNVSGDIGSTSLRVYFDDAKKAEYIFECELMDKVGGYKKLTYIVKPPLTKFQKVINKLKFWK